MREKYGAWRPGKGRKVTARARMIATILATQQPNAVLRAALHHLSWELASVTGKGRKVTARARMVATPDLQTTRRTPPHSEALHFGLLK